MIINRAIVSTDANPLYYEFWPVCGRAWKNINIEPTVAVIGEVHLDHHYGTLIKMPLIPDVPAGFIAQVIRFIIPCFFPEEISVIGDIDMVPLNRDYFSKEISSIHEDTVVIFSSDAYQAEIRYPMCYIAAKGKYFQEIIGLTDTSLATITHFIKGLYSLNLQWATDELFFSKKLHESAVLKKTVFLKRGGWRPAAKNRIDRVNWKYSKFGFFTNKYIDAHLLRPMNAHIQQLKDLIEFVELGSDGKRYLVYRQKRPFRKLADYMGRLRQKLFDDQLFEIADTFGLNNSKTKIIAFSLYGDDPRYLKKLNTIIQLYNEILPDWKIRVYAASDLSQEVARDLIQMGAELFLMKRKGIDARYTMWRFLAIEDISATAVILRDLDSLPLSREKIMIDQWMASDKKLHIIRDHVNHRARIMAGMWGIKENDINLKREVNKMFLTNHYGIDQIFLEKFIFSKFKNDAMIHDRFPRFPEENAIIIPHDGKPGYIGEISTVDVLSDRDQYYMDLYHSKSFTIT